MICQNTLLSPLQPWRIGKDRGFETARTSARTTAQAKYQRYPPGMSVIDRLRGRATIDWRERFPSAPTIPLQMRADKDARETRSDLPPTDRHGDRKALGR
jgi:hypothetical protein